MLADEPLSPKELSESADQPLYNVSYHVRVLAKRDMVRLSDTKPVRGSLKHMYVGNPELWDYPWVLVTMGIGQEDRH